MIAKLDRISGVASVVAVARLPSSPPLISTQDRDQSSFVYQDRCLFVTDEEWFSKPRTGSRKRVLSGKEKKKAATAAEKKKKKKKKKKKELKE